MSLRLINKVRDIEVLKIHSMNALVRQMYESGGFTAKKIAVAVDIIEKMFTEKECITFLSFPANIIATGTRGVIRELINQKLVDVLITTCGTIDHDIARSYKNYYHGDFYADDKNYIHKIFID